MDRQQYPFPKLILLDLKMPGTDGFGFLRWLNSQPQFADLPVVILSSSNLDSDIATARRLGAKDCYTKPQGISELAKVVADICDKWLRL